MNISTVKGIIDSNTYVVELDGTCIIIDAGAPLKAILRALGDYRPSAMFLTHEHFDHIFHIADYMQSFPDCPVYCHPAALSELQTNKLSKLYGGSFDIHVKPVTQFSNVKSLSDNQVLNIGQFTIKAIFSPGHSEGSVVYLINNNLFTGDVLFRNHIGRTDLIPNGDSLMQQTLRRLQSITFEKTYNGHSAPSSFEQQQKNIAKHIYN